MSAESLNRDEDEFDPTVDAEELTTLEEVFDGLEIPDQLTDCFKLKLSLKKQQLKKESACSILLLKPYQVQ